MGLLILLYLGVGVAVAAGLLAAQGCHAREAGIPLKQFAGVCALAAAMWPVLLIGLAQLGALIGYTRRIRTRTQVFVAPE